MFPNANTLCLRDGFWDSGEQTIWKFCANLWETSYNENVLEYKSW